MQLGAVLHRILRSARAISFDIGIAIYDLKEKKKARKKGENKLVIGFWVVLFLFSTTTILTNEQERPTERETEYEEEEMQPFSVQ